MDEIFRKLAKERGLTDEDIDAYLGEKKQQEQISTPSPAPTPPLSTTQNMSKVPDVVNPFTSPRNEAMTQGLNENPYAYGQGVEGHEGVDLINDNPEVTNPIGGINVTGYNPNGYGNWQAIVGANPQELAQMTPEEKDALRKTVGEYISSQPANIRDLNVPGKNVSVQAHLADPAPNVPEIATGSAKLKMGGTPYWDPHLHSVYKDTKGNMRDLIEVIKSMQYR